ncbi:MAG TPA: ATP-dependent zinc metalloprotease FtsH [Acidimicrobiales bacterium]|nr:ATP-dependent zinc metalloprotease FtsH [Acidimicrobiales bacterium]
MKSTERVKKSAKAAGKDSKADAKALKRPRRGAAVLVGSLVGLCAVYGVALAVLGPASPGKEVSFDALTRFATCSSPAAARAGAAAQADATPAVGATAATPADDLAAYCKGVARRVSKARLLDEDARITGTLVGMEGAKPVAPKRFWAAYPKSDSATADLIGRLGAGGAKVTIDSQSQKALVRFVAQFLLPLVILANLFALLFALSKGGSSIAGEFSLFGRLGDKRLRSNEKSNTTFANVAAAGEAMVELAEVRDYLADPSAFDAMGALPPKGVLLMGPPGCGKTLLARAVAGEANAAFFSISGSEFVESLVGVGAARVRDLFRQARASAPAIIFIDELDAAGRQRGAGLGGGNDEREQTLNEMLVQMDGFSTTEGIVVIGATNRADILDPALLRAGRFDRHITVERPDVEGRLAILRLHARGRRLADPEAHLPHIARRTSGFSGADLANVLNESALLAVRERATAIDAHHLEEAVERVLGGPRRKAQLISDDEKARIATHEAGHAVVAAALGKATSLEKVSIIARGRGVGHLAMLSEDKSIFTRDDMEAQVTIAMAGIAAEEIVFGQPSTGAESDLGRATDIARDMAGRFGMSRLGRVRVLHEQREVFLGRDYLSTRDVSQPTLEHLDAEVRRILDEEEAAAHAILSDNRDALDAVTAALVTHETLQGAELARALGGVSSHVRGEATVTAARNGTRARARRSTSG